MNLDEFLIKLNSVEQKNKFTNLINLISNRYQNLTLEFKWNQPMFLYGNQKTFVIGISYSKQNILIAIEDFVLVQYRKIIEKQYKTTTKLIKINWDQLIDFELIFDLIDCAIQSKKDYKDFWFK